MVISNIFIFLCLFALENWRYFDIFRKSLEVSREFVEKFRAIFENFSKDIWAAFGDVFIRVSLCESVFFVSLGEQSTAWETNSTSNSFFMA